MIPASLATLYRRAGLINPRSAILKTFVTTLVLLALVGLPGCGQSGADADNANLKPLEKGTARPEPVNRYKSQRDVGTVLR
jgi:hypothetical protein